MRTAIPYPYFRKLTMWDHGLVLRMNGLVESKTGEMLRLQVRRVGLYKEVCAIFTVEGEEVSDRTKQLIKNIPTDFFSDTTKKEDTNAR